ncbi:hypothetical protein KGP38_06795 [Lactococcus lactis]|uniref:Uncharacterized protein n=1 Tax=Lactococcus lactis TaxID=1358 RepID=A0A9X4S350_9LACT|nr:hypothetical protein [Lactococcus lactis]KST79153.1 hypothetical protein LK231_1161 [Lactococcus lactis subsp. lactis]MBU7542302.1 hypothetical protein [Lactococcus lactis]MDG4980044.1 hypothetical protein [Lactococcus lactis]MDT2911639.1 hypothetical protein [Lactococcus lactis]MDT2933128.1 hypothetical protein [Lactococcus lactis]
MKLEIGKNLEITFNELIEKYDWLLTESSVQSIKKYGKIQTKTKKSVIAQLENQFKSVKVISKKGRYGGTIFELNGFKGLVEYERENKGGRPSLDWSNEELVIRELINEEVALGSSEKFYKGFTINQLYEKMLDFDKYKIEAIAKEEVSIHNIFTLSGNDAEDEYYGLRDTVNNLVRNQRHIYVSLIEKEVKKTNHNIDYLDNNGNEISGLLYEEYMDFKNQLTKELKAENSKNKELKNKYFKAGLSTKDFDIKNEVQLAKEVENECLVKFGFKYAYRLFTILDEIEVEGEGDITLVRENFFNRIMKNANSSQSKHEKTQAINFSETAFYRLVHSGQYVSIMDTVFTKLIGIETKLIDKVEEDSEELQRHLDNVEEYMAEQQQEQEEEFYNQDIYFDVERILYELEHPLSEEECEERYLEMFSY